jgi:SAM-dependent methyltransferase
MSDEQRHIRSSYDAVAAEYAEQLSCELEGKPLDPRLLDDVAARAAGLICDLGCGPGHVAYYLHQRGAAVVGIDLSPPMIAQPRRLHPGPRFEVGDMRSLSCDDASFGAVVALYSLIHFDDPELRRALDEIARVLVPGGLLLAGFHRGSETIHRDEFFGKQVDLDFRLFEPGQIAAALDDVGLAIEQMVERDPYPEVEVGTRRFYVLATVTAAASSSVPDFPSMV